MNDIHGRAELSDLNLLRVFEAVFQARHLTRAADMLALTPSAVSHSLRRLREQLGDPLFTRHGHSMVPTPACMRLAPALFEHMARLRQMLQQWARFDAAQTRQTFRIGMPEAVEMTLMPTLQETFFREAPSASLASATFDRASLARLLAAAQLDLAIDIAQPVREPVRHELLLHDDFCIVASKQHPLKRRPTMKQYLAARHVAVSGRATGTVIEDSTLLSLGFQRSVALRCQNYASAFSVVARSDLLLTVPLRLSKGVALPHTLRRWPTPFDMPRLPLHLYWYMNNDSDAATQWLRGVIFHVAQAHWPDVASTAPTARRRYRPD